MSKQKEQLDEKQGITLLLLKKFSFPANTLFQLILFITSPKNNIGKRKINRNKKTASSEQGGFFVKSGASVSLFPLRRISTPHL